jgi:hypothetical protein
MTRGDQQLGNTKQSEFLYISKGLGLGVADRGKIKIKEI